MNKIVVKVLMVILALTIQVNLYGKPKNIPFEDYLIKVYYELDLDLIPFLSRDENEPRYFKRADKRATSIWMLFQLAPEKDYIPIKFFKELRQRKQITADEINKYIMAAFTHHPSYHLSILGYLFVLCNYTNSFENPDQKLSSHKRSYHSIFKSLSYRSRRSPDKVNYLIKLFNKNEALFNHIKYLYLFTYINFRGKILERFLKETGSKHINHVESFRDVLYLDYHGFQKVIMMTSRSIAPDAALTVCWVSDDYPDFYPRYVTALDLLLLFNKAPTDEWENYDFKKVPKDTFTPEINILRKYGAKTYEELKAEGKVKTLWERYKAGEL